MFANQQQQQPTMEPSNVIRFLSIFVLLIIHNSNDVSALEYEHINNGYLALATEFKYYVSLRNDVGHFCGGSIIGEYHIVTAAHCVIDSTTQEFNEQLIKVARRNSDSDVEIIGKVETIYTPKHFSRGVHDIAVLKLFERLHLDRDSRIAKIGLPYSFQEYDGLTAEAAGAGYDQVSECFDEASSTIYKCNHQVDYRLKYLKVSILPRERCQMYEFAYIIEAEGHICGKPLQLDGPIPRGLCDGDSGGPLVIRNTLVGVVSQGPLSCDETLVPTLYTRVSSYLKFIDQAIADKRQKHLRVAEFDRLYRKYAESIQSAYYEYLKI